MSSGRSLSTRAAHLLWAALLSSSLACGGKQPAAAPPVAVNNSPAPAAASAKPALPPLPTLVGPLLESWKGPYGGVPPFGRFAAADLKPALETAIAYTRAEVDRIAADAAPATFDNTIVAFERSGKVLERVRVVYGVYTSTMSDETVQSIQRELAPKLAELDDYIVQNTRLFQRISEVNDARDKLNLTPEQRRLLWLHYTNFVRAGAKLGDEAKKTLSQINQRLASLYTKFSQNVLAEEDTQMIVLEQEADLAGLPASTREALAATAKARGKAGKWAIANTRSSVDPFLTYSTRRDLRERAFRMFTGRGDNGDGHDNAALITEILRLRLERARLIGFPTHAHWHMDNTMAKTPERAMDLLEAMWKPAVARVREEVADMQAIADREHAGIQIEPWDYRFYAEKVRKAKYDLDQNDVKPYLSLEKLREAMFWVAGELFGLRFSPVTDSAVPVYHPDVRVFQVQGSDGKLVGLWYFDPYSRTGKSSGAWMNEYRQHSRFDGEVPAIVSNNSNFVKGNAGEPVLISWDDARTLFHEFGHALHGLASAASYPSLAGTSVARDYVEFPSQILERWLSTPEVLNHYALHYRTGEPIPAALVKKIAKSETFNQGFTTMEYLASAVLDMKLHLVVDKPVEPKSFERDVLASLGMPKQIVMRHRLPHFGHVFADEGYSAGYYSYLWADTLSADAFEAFVEGKGPYDREVAKRLADHVFSAGNTVDPAEAYRAFRGRDPNVDALMRRRGFIELKKGASKSAPTAPKP